MPVPRETGYPDYGFAAGTKWIPVLFAGKTLEKFYDTAIVTQISTTDYVGEVKNVGDTVYIRTVPSITIKDYKKGQTIELEYPESPSIEFTINKAKYYAFAMDDIDIKETDINWLDKFAADAAEQLKKVYDTQVFSTVYAQVDTANKGATAGKISGNINLGAVGAPLTVNATNILDVLVDCAQVLDEQNIPKSDRYIVIPPQIKSILLKSELRNAMIMGDPKSALRSRSLGQLAEFEIYESNLLSKVTAGGDLGTWNIIFGWKGAMVFVMQLTKNEKYRPQNTFAEAMKGLVVYDFKVIQPTAMGHLYAKVGTP